MLLLSHPSEALLSNSRSSIQMFLSPILLVNCAVIICFKYGFISFTLLFYFSFLHIVPMYALHWECLPWLCCLFQMVVSNLLRKWLYYIILCLVCHLFKYSYGTVVVVSCSCKKIVFSCFRFIKGTWCLFSNHIHFTWSFV